MIRQHRELSFFGQVRLSQVEIQGAVDLRVGSLQAVLLIGRRLPCLAPIGGHLSFFGLGINRINGLTSALRS